MKIELPDEVVEFMRDLAKEIKGQDNRATASPYFYVVQGEKEVIAPYGYGDTECHYYHSEWGEGHTKESWEEILKEHDKENDTTTDIEDFIEDCEKFGMHNVTVEENVFFTEKGLEQHMKLNGHNYRHLKSLLPKGYVKFCFRNPEIEKLHEAIMAFDTPSCKHQWGEHDGDIYCVLCGKDRK